ncbi:MAG TPA: hypothetical protein VD971_04905 [Phycisphaerales bacterium]|nr:hypothetical protein [Phycisphaerales bacterium]
MERSRIARRDAPLSPPPARVRAYREVFWQNAVREMLMALIVLSERKDKDAATDKRMLDGRLAVITRRGRRIPIAGVAPVFAVTMDDCDEARALSNLLQCTIFQVRTPSGEVVTLPLSEVREVHAISDELVRQLEANAAAAQAAESNRTVPFGFAAYTSLARGASGNRRAARRGGGSAV